MTKMIKMSLIAAVAVVGANAKPLEEAIKGVDATGYVTYQYNDGSNTEKVTGTLDDKSHATSNVYKIGLKLTTAATEDVKVVINSSVRGVTTTADASPTYGVSHANFVYSGVKDLTVIAGKQALGTPWTQGSSTIDSTQSGTGILALYATPVATIAGGHFVNNGITGVSNDTTGDVAVDVSNNSIDVLAAIVPVAGFGKVQAWYASIGGSADASVKSDYTGAVVDFNTLDGGAKALSLNANGKIANVTVDARYSTLKQNTADSGTGVDLDIGKQSLTKIIASMPVANVNLSVGYAKTGKKGGLVAFDGDGDAGFSGWATNLNAVELADAKAYLLAADMEVMPKLTVGITHVNAKAKTNGIREAVNNTPTTLAIVGAGSSAADMKHVETYVDVTYAMAKNFTLSAKLGKDTFTDSTTPGSTFESDSTNGRLQVAFTF